MVNIKGQSVGYKVERRCVIGKRAVVGFGSRWEVGRAKREARPAGGAAQCTVQMTVELRLWAVDVGVGAGAVG